MNKWQSDCGRITLYNADCLDVLPGLEGIDAVVTDPPYNIGKAGWDKIPNYLEWCESWIAAASSACKRQGSFWCFHSEPLVLARISQIIERHGRPMLNWVTWDKYNENGSHAFKGFLDGYTVIGGLRRFQDFAEYIVYHADDGQWTAQSDECRGFIFEPLRAYLAAEFAALGWRGDKLNEICGTASMAVRHYVLRSQWCLPTAEHYAKLQAAAGNRNLRREYEDLRREYEDLRPTFNNPGKVSSVWQFPPAKGNGHETPKPVPLMRRIIEATTNPDDTVLDCFAGSGTTGIACLKIGRKAVLIEKEAKHYDLAKTRIQRELAQGRLF